jgi:hypothetical protein
MKRIAQPFACSSLLAFLFLLLAVPVSAQPGGATVSYRKVFKDSTPEFIEIVVHADGTASYDIRQLDDDPDPEPFEVTPALAAKILELSGELNHFRDADLDVKRRIANLGEKTFRYQNGAESYETTFNYTTNATATQLLNIFEGLSRQQEHLTTLERRARYDRLGLNDALLRLEIDMNRRIIPEPERLLPVLETIANDARVIEMARQRARALIERIRSSRPDSE